MFVAAALRALANATPPQDRGRNLRDWLLQLDGVGAGQKAYLHRVRMNGLAATGKWELKLEKAA